MRNREGPPHFEINVEIAFWSKISARRQAKEEEDMVFGVGAAFTKGLFIKADGRILFVAMGSEP